MTRIIIILIINILCIECSMQSNNKAQIYYIVIHFDSFIQNSEDLDSLPQLPITFYGNYNFILLENSKIFYHTKYTHSPCCFWKNNKVKPSRIFLTPNDFKEININELKSFLMNNITDSIIKEGNFFASISSPIDTIRNSGFKIINDYFKEKKLKFYNIRNWTEEEKYTLEAKIENKKYDPMKVDWKVGFGINSDSIYTNTGN